MHEVYRGSSMPDEKTTPRQDHWRKAAEQEAISGNDFGVALFLAIALPNADERRKAGK